MAMMHRVYNPTPYLVVGAFDGSKYAFKPGTSLNLPEETAWWILQHMENEGLVNIDPPDEQTEKSKPKYTAFIVRRALEGLDRYLTTLHGAVESFFTLDTELKQHNQHGTVLRCKQVKELTQKIETVTHLIADIEKKHGVSIAKQDYEEKSASIMNSIEETINAFEADEERKMKSLEDDARTNKVLQEIQKGIAPTLPV